MSDEPSKSQRMSWNNDGMDPDWKPTFSAALKSDPLDKLEALILACEAIVESARKVPDESKPVDGAVTINWWRVSASSSVWNKFVKAFDEVKFK